MKKITGLFILTLLITSALIIKNGFTVNANDLYIGNNDPSQEVKTITKIRASHILIDSEKKANKIREEILAGKSFEDEAKKYSTCPSGAEGGDLGFFEKGMMVPEFEKAAFNLPVGEISKPVKTQYGWHLIKVTEQK